MTARVTELPDGHGVLLKPVCGLCEEPLTENPTVCTFCQRSFCPDCFAVHLIARDALDADMPPPKPEKPPEIKMEPPGPFVKKLIRDINKHFGSVNEDKEDEDK